MTALQDSQQKDLERLVTQIERLEEEKRALAADIADKYKEATNKGFVVKQLRKIIADRRKDASDRAEEEAIYDAYAVALGMLPMGIDWRAQRRQEQVDRVAANMV